MIELKTILLVEDDPKDVELIVAALEENHLANRVNVVGDGVEALAYLRCEEEYKSRQRVNPGVILLDIKMPRMDGIELLEIIRNDKRLKKIPVVMLTSSREEPDLKRCYELGSNAYVVKPVDFKEFIVAVKRVGVFWAMLNELPKDTD